MLRLLQRIVTSLGVTRLIELIFSLHFRGMFNTSQCSVFLYQSSYKVEGQLKTAGAVNKIESVLKSERNRITSKVESLCVDSLPYLNI